MDVPQNSNRRGTTEADAQVRKILSEIVDLCRKQQGQRRADIAKGMTQVLGRAVTESMLRDFIRNARDSKDGKRPRDVRFPAAWVPAFCQATGDDTLQRYLLNKPLRKALELGELLIRNQWVLEVVKIKFGKAASRGLRKLQISKRLRGAR